MLGLGLSIRKGGGIKRYVLNKTKSTVLAISSSKLHSKATSPFTLSFVSAGVAEGSPDFVTSFKNGKLNTEEVEAYIARNRLSNPTLLEDTNGDGVANSGTASFGALTTVTFAIDGGQRISIANASSNAVSAAVYLASPAIKEGETFEFSVEYRTDANMNARLGCVSKPTNLLLTNPINNRKSVGTWCKETLTYIAPPGTTAMDLILALRSDNVGDTGSVWFRNVSFKKIARFMLSNALDTDGGTGVPTGFLLNGIGNVHSARIENGCQYLDITSSLIDVYSQIEYSVSNVNPGEYITLSVEGCTSNPVIPVRTWVNWLRGDGSFISNGFSTTNTTDKFTTLSVSLVAPAETAKCILLFGGLSLQAGAGAIMRFKNVRAYRANVSAYVKQATDQSMTENNYPSPNLLGSDGNFGTDTNMDGLANGYVKQGAGVTTSVTNNIQSFTPSGQYTGIQHVVTPITGHKYYACAYIRTTHASAVGITLQSGGFPTTGAGFHTGSGNWEFMSTALVTATSNVPGSAYCLDNLVNGYQNVDIKQHHVFNLTDIFGGGKEPIKATVDSLVQAGIAKYGYINGDILTTLCNHATQLTLANMPLLLRSGIWEMSKDNRVAMSLDGVSNFMMVSDTPTLNITSAPLGMFATIKTPGVLTNSYIISKGLDGLANMQYGVYINSDSTWIVVLENAQRKITLLNSVVGDLRQNLGGFWDGEFVKAFIDTVNKAPSGAYVGTLTSLPNVRIGCRAGPGGTHAAYFKGHLETVTIHAGANSTESNVIKVETELSR